MSKSEFYTGEFVLLTFSDQLLIRLVLLKWHKYKTANVELAFTHTILYLVLVEFLESRPEAACSDLGISTCQ